jgi:hypothetical protein
VHRRTLLQWLASTAASLPLLRGRLAAQAPAFSPADVALLEEIAVVVLPSALGRAGAEAVVQQFVRWHRNYRAGADLGHGYGGGSTRVRTAGPPPGGGYAVQLAAIARAADARGARFGSLPLETRREIVEAALGEADVQRLPSRPAGGHVVADLMGLYFGGSGAQDLCYGAAIGRDTCRGLPESDRAPAPLRR